MNILQFSALLIWLLFVAVIEAGSQLRPRVGVRAMSPWNKWWVRGWLVILAIALVYEGVGAWLEWTGNTAFPTLSRLIANSIPLVILEPLTLIVAIALMIHWIMVCQLEHAKALTMLALTMGVSVLALSNNQPTIQLSKGVNGMEILLTLINQIPTLVGIGALVSVLISVGKMAGIVTDGNSQNWVAAVDLVLLIGLFVGGLVGLTPEQLSHYDGMAGAAAQLLTYVIALLAQVFSSKATYVAFKGVPIVGKSFSLK